MTEERSSPSRKVLAAVRRYGLLLRADAALPSVAGIVAGGPVRGSWWAHPASHDIYHVSLELGEHPDVLVAKLVSGKDTFVHRRLWPALFAVGSAREPWQLEGLPAGAERLLRAVDDAGELRTDEVPWSGGRRKDSPGEAARHLERRLLVYADEVHTETGAHAKRLQTWRRWAKRVRLERGKMTPEAGRRQLEEALAPQNERFQGRGRLPWQ